MNRVILHSDANAFYASVEQLYRPELRGKPIAVCGDPDARHGIVLTKSEQAKRMGVKTGMAIWQARQKCPDLVTLPPNYPLYVHYSHKLRSIYEQYSDRVEAFGLDESWLDVSAPGCVLSDGVRIADEIHSRARDELGITVSVGVADNKVFAKLGSDYKKPDATTLIDKASYDAIIRPLPVSDLLYVGPQTTRKLMNRFIYTIGDLADADTDFLMHKLGKNGLMLKAFAMGLDTAPVMHSDAADVLKSVGNSATPPHDLVSPDDVRRMIYLLADSVGARMRAAGFRARRVSLGVRTTELEWFQCQLTLKRATSITDDIAHHAIALFEERFADKLPLRSLGVTCGLLSPASTPVQLDMFGDEETRMKREALDRALDDLRRRFGHNIVQRGVVMADRAVASINPRDEHSIHPVAFASNRSEVIRRA